jgi:hypothetical protein
MKDAGHGDAGAVKLACLGCDAPMSFGSSECFECGTRYRYVEGRAVAENLDELEPDEAANRALREAAARASATGFHPPLGVVQREVRPIARPNKGLALGTALALLATPFLGAMTTSISWLGHFALGYGYGSADPRFFDAFSSFASGLTSAVGLAGLGTAFLFLLWMSRCNRVVRAIGAKHLRFAPAGCVFWWFVPFANFLVPYRAMTELWKASHPNAGATDWVRGRVSPVIPLWWATWLASWLFNATDVASVFSRSLFTGAYDFLAELVSWMGAMTIRLVCGILAAWIVWNIHVRLEEKASIVA